MLPPLTIGMCRPTGLVGRLISARQDSPYSHAVVALGNGRVWESTWRWTRLTEEPYWTERPPTQAVDWWALAPPLTAEQARVLRSVAYFTAGRIHYSLGALVAFIVRGVPGRRGHNLFCTYGVAELLMTALDLDVSGAEQPWNVDLRALHSALVLDTRWQRIEP